MAANDTEIDLSDYREIYNWLQKYGKVGGTNDTLEMLLELNKVTSLHFMNLGIKKIPESIGCLRNLRYLYLSNNTIRTLPTGLFGLNLEHLWLDENIISIVPDGIGRCSTLRSLWLNNNKLYTLPVDFSMLKNLEHLELFRNNFSKIPDCIGGLVQLKILNMWNNNIQFLTGEVFRCKNLILLDVSRNNIRCVGNGISNLTNLERLHMSENRLKSMLPITQANLPNLKSILLETNNITKPPTDYSRLKSLRLLSLYDNEFTTKEGECIKEALKGQKSQ